MCYIRIMLAVAKKFPKEQVTIRVNPTNLRKLEAHGERLWKNRSEMIDRAIEEYVTNHADELPADQSPTAAD